MAPFVGMFRGLAAYPRGLSWLRAHPRYVAWLALPFSLGCILLVFALSAFFRYDDAIMARVLFDRPDSWYGAAFYWVCRALIYVGGVVIAAMSAYLGMNVAAAPIYDVVSAAVEREQTGREPPSLDLMHSLLLMFEELKKVVAILTVSILVLLIPGLNVISWLISAFLVGWDFVDYPLARRGWSFKQRLQFVLGEFFAVLGLGLWLIIPFVAALLVPWAVAGGTLLALDALGRREGAVPGTTEQRPAVGGRR